MLGGCLALLLMALGFLLLINTSGLSLGTFLLLALLILGLGFAVFMWVENYGLRKAKEGAASREQSASAELQREHELDEVFANVDAGKFIGISWSTEEIVTGATAGAAHRFRFAQLADVEIEIRRFTITDDEHQTTTNRGSQIIGAATGGALFGAAGAVVGGLSGSKTTVGSSFTTEGISAIDLRVRFRDRAQPVVEVPFYDVEMGTSYLNKQGERMDAARRLHAHLSNILDEKRPA